MSMLWRSDELPPRDRFPAWYEMTQRSHVPTEIRSDHESDFRASMKVVPLGPVQVSGLTYPSLVARRGSKLIRRSDPELYQLTLGIRGRMAICQKGKEATVGARSLALYHTSSPFHGYVMTSADQSEVIQTQVPRNLLSQANQKAGDVIASAISTSAGPGALLAQYLVGILSNAGNRRPDVAVKLGHVVADLLAVLIDDLTGEDARQVADSRQRTLALAVHAYIERHLADPDLSLDKVATAHHLSVRSLQRLFQEQCMSVTEWIRNRRLERCRRDLVDPLFVGQSIHTIAASWQFTSQAHFTRLFRSTYGLTPGEYRRLHTLRLS